MTAINIAILVDPSSKLVVKSGQIIEWNVVMMKPGSVTFLVWRKTDSGYLVVGSTEVTGSAGDNKHVLDGNNRIGVQEGDNLGFHVGTTSLIPYSEVACKANSGNAQLYTDTPQTPQVGKIYPLQSFPGFLKPCRKYSLYAVVLSKPGKFHYQCWL